MLTTVAVISDTHAHLDSRVLSVVRECDIAVHGGDVCGVDILESLQPKSGKVYVVTGNNDPYCHDSDEALPKILSFEVLGEKITVEHGHEHGMTKPDHDSLRKAHQDSKIVIYGHTHKMLVDSEKKPWVINPGAAGKTRTRGGPSCLVIECRDDRDWIIHLHRFSESP